MRSEGNDLDLMSDASVYVVEPGLVVQRVVVPAESSFVAMLGQTWHEFTVLDGMGEGVGAVEVTVAASPAFVGALVPFARALCLIRRSGGEWRVN